MISKNSILASINPPTVVSVNVASELLDIEAGIIRRWHKKGLIKTVASRSKKSLFRLEELQQLLKKSKGEYTGQEFKVLKRKPSPYSVIELFSGCGGMALGLENAGLQTKLLVEIDRDATKTLMRNRPEWHVIHSDVADVDFRKYRDRIDVVAGGFPCQAFSYAGHSRGFEDIRGTLFYEFARCVDQVRPKIALAENVRGLITHDHGKTFETMRGVLRDLGYFVSYKLLRAQFFDVPQKRERVFVLGIRNDLDIQPIFPREKSYTVSLREALKDCPPSVGAEYPANKKRIMEHVPEGGYWRDLPIDLQKEYMKKSFFLSGGKTGMARRLAWDEPSLTLTCSPAQKQTERCHPQETRPLNIKEYARIQSFPYDWEFEGSIASQYKQIGNAVPVNLAFHIGCCIVGMLSGEYNEENVVLSQDWGSDGQETLNDSEQLSISLG